jgi:hypothetical protein
MFRDLRPGTTATATGVSKTLLTRAEKKARVREWADSMTEEARTEYMIGEQYASLSENAQDIIAEAFGEIEERAYEDSIGIENIDFDVPTPEVDDIVGDSEDTEDEAADDDYETDYETMFNQAEWEGEQ